MIARDFGEFSLGLSPCPNDTFIFHALISDEPSARVRGGAKPRPWLADVEKLNRAALAGELEITKISAGALPAVADKYAILNAGAALGWGCGPLLVARENLSLADLADAAIAIPGKMTTANALLDSLGSLSGPRREVLFSEIMSMVASGEVAAGVIIHEGRFTYPNYGLKKILDLGQWWEEKFRVPLPLGVIVARRDLPRELAFAVQEAIAASLAYARAHPDASREFVASHARELDEAVTRAHIDTFVTDYSRDLGRGGREAIRAFLRAAGRPADKVFLDD